MAIADLFPSTDAVLRLAPANKAELLGMLAQKAASSLARPEDEVREALEEREQLGSTALGRGVAMPHARMEGIAGPSVILARLDRPIDFDARDGEPVDLVFSVVWPAASPEGFLPALSGICKALRVPQLTKRLRQAKSADEALALLREAEDGEGLADAE